jgi:2-hydroxy-3-keto-5-methylthiopentenyl-1-phosphate phosphatase
MKPQLLVACDFDGTVTRQDTLVEILDTYGSPNWRQIQDRVVSGEMSIREGLQHEMASVKATANQLKTLLRERVSIESTFVPFLHKMRVRGIPVVLLTGGFDLCVETVLEKNRLGPLPALSNRLIPTFSSVSNETGGGSRPKNGDQPEEKEQAGWQVQFPFPSDRCQACGYCKADPIRDWNRKGYKTIFIGNGVTDRCPAAEATLTFAKEELLDWSESEGIAAVPFETFNDVEDNLRKRKWL